MGPPDGLIAAHACFDSRRLFCQRTHTRAAEEAEFARFAGDLHLSVLRAHAEEVLQAIPRWPTLLY